MLTADEIAKAKSVHAYPAGEEPNHEHDDCIRIAYQWLDAQPKLSRTTRHSFVDLKGLIEHWGGRYVSRHDVEVAAALHPKIFGAYPYFNLGSKRVFPSFDRLANIPEANSQPDYRLGLDKDRDVYKTVE